MSLRVEQLFVPRYLVPMSLLYLALPVAVFLFGWLVWYFAVPAAGLLGLACLGLIRRESRDRSGGTIRGLERVSRSQLLLLFLAALFLVLQSGIGGYGPQDTDWLKHNAILKDLIERPWPVVYEYEGAKLPLVYYLAYYLPAALAGKIGGWDAANQVLLVWSLAGLVVALLWFRALVGRAGAGVLVFFVFFSGIDSLGVFYDELIYSELSNPLKWWHIEWWARNWSYQSNITLLWWVPQMALAGWILTALVMHSLQRRKCARDGLLYLGISPLWSPFLSIGLAVYLAVGYLRESAIFRGRLYAVATVQNFCGLVLLGLHGLFYGSKLHVHAAPGGRSPAGFIFMNPLSKDLGASEIAWTLVLFWLLEFGCYGILIFGCRAAEDTPPRALFWVTMILLLVLPLYRYGHYNDLAMRASIPALFVLGILVARTLFGTSTPRRCRVVLLVLLIAGSLTPLQEFKRHAGRVVRARTIFFRPESREVKELMSLYEWGYRSGVKSFLGQYTGSAESPFFRHLAAEAGFPGGANSEQK